MGKGTIKIAEIGSAYIPDELRNDGFVGSVDFLANGKTVTLMRPEATLDEVEKSLRITLREIKIRKGE